MCATVKPYSAATGLPKKAKSICPECGKILEATIFEKDGKVFMEKECPEHGKFCDVYWSDAAKYLEAEKYAKDGTGLKNSMDENLKDGRLAFDGIFCVTDKLAVAVIKALRRTGLLSRMEG